MILAFSPISFGRQVALTCATFSACILLMLLLGGCSEWREEDEIVYSYPANWPITPLTGAEIEEVSQCRLEEIAAERYPNDNLKSVSIDELPDAYSPKSACDWAVLATAYAERVLDDDALPESAKEAFIEAISRNYGFAVTAPLFYRYFGEVSLVESPPFVKQEITAVKIDYTWVGLAGSGEPEKFSYSVKIEQAHTKPVVSATVIPESSVPNLSLEALDPDKIQALGPALADLLPIESQFEFVVCTDNYPDWSISLTFKDGTQLDLITNGSNFLFAGGPWQTKIDGQNYVQFSFGFVEAIIDLFEALGLPFGSPAGMVCWGDTLFEKAFPD
ncbi:hypothetical protein J4G02_19395 [Candidatus Poribacteria bacterium]|nr:hypothetical protein [Candidatus Poribacteria bacterium]